MTLAHTPHTCVRHGIVALMATGNNCFFFVQGFSLPVSLLFSLFSYLPFYVLGLPIHQKANMMIPLHIYLLFRLHSPLTYNGPIQLKYFYLCYSLDLYILIKETTLAVHCLQRALCRYHPFRKSSHPIHEIVTRYNVMVVIRTSNKPALLHRLLGEKVSQRA